MLAQAKFPADNLWRLAVEAADDLTDERTMRNIDRTELFLYELEQHVKKGELLNINVNGVVRTGKSTGAMALVIEIKQLIEKHHHVKRPMSVRNILRDQNEYSRVVKQRPESYLHECDQIDEWAEMETTGYNATIEEKYLKDFSDRQAARYYHRVACSPGEQIDANSDIILSTIPGSRENGRTMFLLHYRLNRRGVVEPVLIGHIIIDVRHVLSAAWYKEYLRRKAEKWELMNKDNVKSPRELEYANIILATYNRIKEMAKYGLTRKEHFKAILLEEADTRGVWFSILGDKDIMETIKGLADLTQAVNDVTEKRYRTERLVTENKLPQEALEATKRMEKELKQSLAESLHRQERLADLWTKYQRIDEEDFR